MKRLFLLIMPDSVPVCMECGEEVYSIVVAAENAMEAKHFVIKEEMERCDLEYTSEISEAWNVSFETLVQSIKSFQLGVSYMGSLKEDLKNTDIIGCVEAEPVTFESGDLVEMFTHTFQPTDCASAAEFSNVVNNNSACLNNIGATDYPKRTAALARTFGYNQTQRYHSAPQCKVTWSYLVEAVNRKLTELNWPCEAKTTVLADLRLLPYNRNKHTWEIDFVPGLNQRCFRVTIKRKP